MSGLELAALCGLAIWLAVLSFVILLVTRQIGLITVRLSLLAPHAPVGEEGPELGSSVPPEVRALGDDDGVVLLLLSGTCGDCRALAARLRGRELATRTVALVAGQRPLAEAVADMLPNGIDVRFDPEATRIAEMLRLEMVPFGIRIDAGTVSMKAYLHGPEDVWQLMAAGRGDDHLAVVQGGASSSNGNQGQEAVIR